jgi:ABC-type lipoprotein export system ATPase subunit
MQQPSVLLCGEPIASLDPASAQVVMELIRSKGSKEGKMKEKPTYSIPYSPSSPLW